MNRSPPVVRLGPGEEARLRALRLRALEDAPRAFGSTCAEVAARPPQSWTQQLRDLPTFVAVSHGADVGIVRGAPDPERPGVAWLISMWVAPTARGQGVGDALVAAVVAWARASGFRQLRLGVGDHNAPAIALYARHGFVPDGVTDTVQTAAGPVTEHDRVLDLDGDTAESR